MNTVKPVSSDAALHDHPVLSNHFPRSQIFQPFITISVTFTSIKWLWLPFPEFQWPIIIVFHLY